MYVCAEVGISQKPYNLSHEKEQGLLTLEQYQTIAKKLIAKYANSVGGGLADHMLRNEDAIAWITECLAKADIKWDPAKTPIKEHYRVKVTIWACKRYKYNLAVESKRKHGECHMSHKKDSLHWDSQAKAPITELIEKEEQTINPAMVKLMMKSKLSDVQKLCLICKFYGNLTYDEIADKCGVERQRIHQIIDKALLQMKKWANYS